MSRFLLDTGPVAAYLRGRPGSIRLIQPWIDNGEAATNSLVYAEVIEYFKSLTAFPTRRALLRAFMRLLRTYELTYAVLERYADLRRSMRPPNGPGLIGDIDLLIAASAIQQNATVVTIDSDFSRVPGLSVMLLDRQALR